MNCGLQLAELTAVLVEEAIYGIRVMRIKSIITIGTALLLTTTLSRAAHIWEDPGAWSGGVFTYQPDVPKYNAQELSLDLFGSYNNPEGKLTDLFKTNIRHGFWGGGAGLNYFFTRQLGLGVDFNMSSKPEGSLVDDVIGNLYLRFPIGNSGLAPYIYGGGGRGIYPVYQWYYGGGVGLEYRFNPTMGIFTDGRFLWSEKETALNRLFLRAGVRLVF